MICPRCGGELLPYMNCSRCGVPYSEIIESVRHDEMKNLFPKINESIKNNENVEEEESLLAGMLAESSLLVPVTRSDGELAVMTVEDERGRKYILLFTDKEEYDKNISDMPPMTNPFPFIMDLLDERFEGFVVNVEGVQCELSKGFLERHFGGDS